jgi:transposase
METGLARDLMSDDEWAFHERFILAIRAPNGRKPVNHRLVLDGIFWIARTGSPWRDLPEEFGKWSSVYRQFRRWTLAGLWEDILEALNASGLAPDALQMIDIEPVSTTGSSEPARVVRAHHQAAGAKGGLRDRVSAVQEVASRPRSTSASTAQGSR